MATVNENTTQGTAAASSGAAGAIVVIAVWALSLVHLNVPAEVSAAGMVLVSAAIHFATVRFATDESKLATPAPKP